MIDTAQPRRIDKSDAGPLTRILQKTKRAMMATLDAQELNVYNNRRKLPPGLQVPNKLLGVPRSKDNVILEIAPFVESTKLKSKGKAATALPKSR